MFLSFRKISGDLVILFSLNSISTFERELINFSMRISFDTMKSTITLGQDDKKKLNLILRKIKIIS